jgi:hypothetical protein
MDLQLGVEIHVFFSLIEFVDDSRGPGFCGLKEIFSDLVNSGMSLSEGILDLRLNME